MVKTLTIGYSPYGWQEQKGVSPFFPFDDVFDHGLNCLLETHINMVDAILLWGGSDISPSLYNEEPINCSGPKKPSDRDLFEWELCRRAFKAQKPLIGVCRGAQLICAFAGGKLIQDVTNHGVTHNIDCYDKSVFRVTSSHHQMMYPYDVPHELLAWSSQSLSHHYYPEDKYYSIELEQRREKEPEVVYFPEINALAIQPHPEWHDQGHPFNNWICEQIINRQFK